MKDRIKNENAYLGLLIKHMNDKKYVDYGKILPYIEDRNIVAFNHLFEERVWIRDVDNEGFYLTTVGINNYISWKDRIISWLIAFLQFAVSYTLGILSGVLVAWVISIIGLS